MNFSELFIRRPIMTLLLTITVTAFGVQMFRQLPVNDLPAVDYPVIQVNVTYPGASPETMANTCATPLEKQFLPRLLDAAGHIDSELAARLSTGSGGVR